MNQRGNDAESLRQRQGGFTLIEVMIALVVLVVGGALYLAGGQDAAVGAPPTGVGSTSATETPVGAATDPAAGDPSEATPAEEKTPAEVAEETTPEPPTPPPASATGGGSEPKTTGAGTRPHGGKFRGRGSDEATPAPSGEPADDGSG